MKMAAIIDLARAGPAEMARSVGLAKAALMIWGGVSLLAIPVGAALYMQGWAGAGAGDASNTQRTAEMAPVADPRLPRARPHEPIVTGSIRATTPASEQAEPPPATNRRSMSVPRGLDDLGVLAGALASLANTPAKVDQPRTARLTDGQAIRACEDKVRSGLPYPTSLKRLVSSTDVYRAAGDDAVVTFDFDTVNGFGFPLALQANCAIGDREIARLEVSPR